MGWKFESGRPIYTQIVEEMTLRIASGIYGLGEKLPSVREMAVEAGVNPNTIQRALAELERKGLVYTERTNGRFVTGEAHVLEEIHEELAQIYVQELLEKLRKIGLSEKEIGEAVRKGLERWH